MAREQTDKFNEYMERAQNAMKQGSWSSACDYLRGALTIRPQDDEATRLLNQARANEADAKWNFLTRALADLLATLKYLFGARKGACDDLELLHKSQNFKEGKRNSKRLAMMYGRCARACNEPREAIDAFEFVRNNFASNEPALFALKDLYLEQQEFDKAAEILVQLTASHPNDSKLDKQLRDAQAQRFSQVGVPQDLMAQRGEVERKRVEAQDKVSEKSEIEQLNEEIAQITEWKTARANGEPVPRDTPPDEELERQRLEKLHRLADRYTEVGQKEEALEVYDRLLEENEGDEQAWRKAAPLCYDLERWGDASMAYEKLLELEPDNEEFVQRRLEARRHELEETLRANPDDFEAKTALEQVSREELELKERILEERVRKQPGNVDLLLEYARFLMDQNRYEDALPPLQQARATPQKAFVVRKLLGICYREQGMTDLAEESLAEALEKAPPQTGFMREEVKETYYLLGDVREELGRNEEAREAFKVLMENDIKYKDVRDRFMALSEKLRGENSQ